MTTAKRKKPGPKPRPKESIQKRTLHRERVSVKFSGKYTSPKDVSDFLGVDRAAACRILQMLVKRGEAKTGALRGEYLVYKP